MQYTSRERARLSTLALVSFVGLNGVFLWAMLSRPQLAVAAFQNPVAVAFIAEAFVLVGVLACLLARWRVSQMHWRWFVLLALVGGIAFALPVMLLWGGQRARPEGAIDRAGEATDGAARADGS
jgi:hypothetical protein